jgi:hypothetical protein
MLYLKITNLAFFQAAVHFFTHSDCKCSDVIHSQNVIEFKVDKPSEIKTVEEKIESHLLSVALKMQHLTNEDTEYAIRTLNYTPIFLSSN